MTDTQPSSTQPSVTGSKKIKRDGPEAQAIIRYLTEHTDHVLSIGEVSAATGAPHNYVGNVLSNLANHTAKGTQPDVLIFRPLSGMVKRVGIGAYYVDTKGTQSLLVTQRTTVEPNGSAPAPNTDDSSLLVGALMEVIKTYDNGRVILACEQGHVYTGTLTKVDA